MKDQPLGTVEWRENSDDEWQSAGINSRIDYLDQKFSKVDLLDGTWPGDDTIAVGQGNDLVFGLDIGDQITINVDNRQRVYTITGAVTDPLVQPPSFGGTAQLYVSRDTFEDLFDTRSLNRILAASTAKYDPIQTTMLANEIRDKLEKQNVDSYGFLPPTGGRVVDPNKHFFQDAMDGIFFVLTVMASWRCC